MKTKIILLSAVGLALLVFSAISAFSQQATVKRNSNLRKSPTTSSDILEELAAGSQVTLISNSKHSGYYNVRAEDDAVGWAWARNISVGGESPSPTPSPTPESPTPPPESPTPTQESPTPTPTPSGSSTPQPGNQGFDPGCTLPFDAIKQKHPIIDDSCSRDGTTSGGGQPSPGKLAENHAKNNFCLAGTPIDISYDDLKQLQSQTEQNNVQEADLTDEATRATKLGNLITVDGHSLGEGTLVRTLLYVLDAHPADTIDQFPNSYGESVNCYRPSAEENDVHIALGEQTHVDECLSVTAEMSPHFRPVNWTPDRINSVGEHPVRVTGQLFYDSSHQPCKPGKPASPKRVSLWEIHPVYAFEVCTSSTDINQCKAAPESAWQPLDQFTP